MSKELDSKHASRKCAYCIWQNTCTVHKPLAAFAGIRAASLLLHAFYAFSTTQPPPLITKLCTHSLCASLSFCLDLVPSSIGSNTHSHCSKTITLDRWRSAFNRIYELPDNVNKLCRMVQHSFLWCVYWSKFRELLSEGFSDQSNSDMNPQQYNSYYERSLNY